MPIDMGGASNMLKLAKEEELDWLTFTAVEQNTSMNMIRVGSLKYNARFDYRIGDGTWKEYLFDEAGKGIYIELVNIGDFCQFRAHDFNQTICENYVNGYRIRHNKNGIECSGDLLTLVSVDGKVDKIPSHAYFYRFFSEGTKLTKLPYIGDAVCSSWCYLQLYGYYSSISADTGSIVLSKDSSEMSFAEMYQDTKICFPGEFPNITKARVKSFFGCYKNTPLEYPPDLSKITVFEQSSCESIFQNCLKLSMALFINPNATFYKNAFKLAYSGCILLNEIRVGIHSWYDDKQVFLNWVQGVSPTGTFTCPVELPVIFDDSHIPFGWKVDNGSNTVTEEEVLNACYQYQNGRLVIQPDFKACLNKTVQTDYVWKGKVYWKAGTPLPNPHRPDLNSHYSVTSLSTTFNEFRYMPAINLDEWDVSEVISIERCFRLNRGWKRFDMKWTTPKLTNIVNTFNQMANLEYIDLSTWDFSNTTATTNAFLGVHPTTAYARTQADCDKLNASANKPTTWQFTVHPDLLNVPAFTVSGIGEYDGIYDAVSSDFHPVYRNGNLEFTVSVQEDGSAVYLFRGGASSLTSKTALYAPVAKEACTGKRYLLENNTYTDGADDYTAVFSFDVSVPVSNNMYIGRVRTSGHRVSDVTPRMLLEKDVSSSEASESLHTVSALPGDTVIVAVPEGYTAFRDDGTGGTAPFDENIVFSETGENGALSIPAEGGNLKAYGQLNIVTADTIIHIKKENI